MLRVDNGELINAARRSPAFAAAERVLGIDSTGERQLFPTYTEWPANSRERHYESLESSVVVGNLEAGLA
jgi:hypothetical protein